MKRVYLVLFLISFLGCSFSNPKDDFSSMYCDANERLDSIQSFENCISIETSDIPSDYILHEGHLFLRMQSIRSTSIVVQGESPKWSIEKIEKLVSENPELIPYLPDKDASNKGIVWIKK